MPSKPLSNEVLRETILAVARHDGRRDLAAKELGLDSRTVCDRLKLAEARGVVAAMPAELPEVEEDMDAFTDQLAARAEQIYDRHEAEKWQRIHLPDAGPYGLLVVGDPHLDDAKCAWHILKKHIALCAYNPRIFCVNIGDLHNNWVGRLERLYAEQETSKNTAYKLIRWLMHDCGLNWILSIAGNHDVWNDGYRILEMLHGQHVVLRDWGAKVVISSKDGRELRLDARHNFKGSSIWNDAHGPEREAITGELADLYVAGHLHYPSIKTRWIPSKGHIAHLVRAAGYKQIDTHAHHHGFAQANSGHSIFVLVKPYAEETEEWIQPFASVKAGVEALGDAITRWQNTHGEATKMPPSKTAKKRGNAQNAA